MTTLKPRLIATLCLAGLMAMAAGAELTPVPDDIAKAAKDSDGWKPVFKDDLSNAIMEENGWSYADGMLAALGNGDIWTKERYGNFVLDLEFTCSESTNSGVFIRTDSIKHWLHTAIEVQVLQPGDKYENPRHHVGGIFDCVEPASIEIKRPGEWNHYQIIAKDNWIFVTLNDVLVTSMDLDKWTEKGKNPDGTPNKFRFAYKDMAREGHLGFQYHGDPVWFRNLKVKPLD